MMPHRYLFPSNIGEKQPKQWIYIKGEADSTKEYQHRPQHFPTQFQAEKWEFKAKI